MKQNELLTIPDSRGKCLLYLIQGIVKRNVQVVAVIGPLFGPIGSGRNGFVVQPPLLAAVELRARDLPLVCGAAGDLGGLKLGLKIGTHPSSQT